MLLRVKPRHPIRSSEITDREVFEARREFLRTSIHLGLAGAAGLGLGLWPDPADARSLGPYSRKVITVDEELTPKQAVTSYNNFYEFSTDKEGPAKLAGNFRTDPWNIKVSGEVEKPGNYHLEDFIKPHKLEERIYRFRCVEAWSMVVPWIGIPLASVIKAMKPTSKAKYVEFRTLFDPEQMPGQKRRVLDWPYVEGLRIDEAMHPLSILVVGLYGDILPNQNGAPIRLMVPWKYGFKNIKSIVSLNFTDKQPESTWERANAREYGFYANVNPTVSHPRWSQAKERRIGEFFKRDTLMFNGYEEEVAHLYAGMDLKKNF